MLRGGAVHGRERRWRPVGSLYFVKFMCKSGLDKYEPPIWIEARNLTDGYADD